MNGEAPSPQEALELARGHLERGNLATAINLYRGIPSSSRSFKKARKALKLMQKSNPSAWRQALLEADINELLHLHETAPSSQVMSRARQLAKSHSGQPLPHNVMGTVYMKREQFAEAAKCFNKALELAPDFLDARNNLGAAYSSLEEFPLAIASYRAVLGQRPGDADTHSNLGNALRQQGEMEAAIASYETAIGISPGETKPRIGLAKVLMDMRKPSPAIALLEQAIAIEPTGAGLHRLCGVAHKALGQWEQALDCLATALEQDPEDHRAHYESGLVYLQQDNKQAASSSLQKAVNIQPDNPDYQHFLAAASGITPEKSPEQTVTGLFDAYANSFDDHLVSQLEYSAPQQLRQLLDRIGEPGQRFARAIDLGCGTGLCGQAFGDRCDHLTGIDLSEKMLAKASAKGVYDRLLQDDVVRALDQLDESFDLFLCSDTFIYLGDLAPVFQSISRRAQKNALLLFTTELSQQAGMELLPSGRYAHNKSYLNGIASAAGFDTLTSEQVDLRKELSRWIPGELYLLRHRG